MSNELIFMIIFGLAFLVVVALWVIVDEFKKK